MQRLATWRLKEMKPVIVAHGRASQLPPLYERLMRYGALHVDEGEALCGVPLYYVSRNLIR